MSDRQLIEETLRSYLGSPFSIESQRSLGGGCINDAYLMQGSGRSFFVKANALSFRDGFATEADALRELAASRTVRVPEVIALLDGTTQSYLILEYIDTRTSGAGDWAKLGQQLATLHKTVQPFFGWTQDNRIGATPQPNPQTESWIEFFRVHRLEHQLRLCRDRGYTLPHADDLLSAVPDFFVDYQPHPSLLHGDLWSGNVSFDQAGSPFLYDPATYYGDRETDLAFTEFFGGFGQAFYEAYQETLPLDFGYKERKTLYNLYHCLNHLYLFGASYASQAERMTQRLLSR